MRKALPLLVAAFMAFASGCHAQIPLVTHGVNLTWTASPGTTTKDPTTGATVTTACTTSGTNACTYVMGRYTLTSADAGKCPAVNMSAPNYTPINSASPTTALTLFDSGSAGTTACYEVQAVQLGNPSGSSNVAGPFVVAANTNPGAPTLGNGTVAEQHAPQPALPTPADPEVASERAAANLEGQVQ